MPAFRYAAICSEPCKPMACQFIRILQTNYNEFLGIMLLILLIPYNNYKCIRLNMKILVKRMTLISISLNVSWDLRNMMLKKNLHLREERRKKKYTSNTNFPTNLPFETLWVTSIAKWQLNHYCNIDHHDQLKISLCP